MGTSIEFTRPDGATAPGYLAPAPRAGAPGIVLFEEWWGVDAQIKAVADRFARSGFAVLVPDIFRGSVTDDPEVAGHMMEGLDFADAATQDAPGAAAYLRAHGAAKVGVSGFCAGGALAMLAAMKTDAFDAAVIFSGFPPAEAGDPAEMRIPVQGHWSLQDAFFPIARVDAIEARLREAGVPHEFHRYDAKHAFYNPRGLGNYVHEHAETAFTRAQAFFHKTLG